MPLCRRILENCTCWAQTENIDLAINNIHSVMFFGLCSAGYFLLTIFYWLCSVLCGLGTVICCLFLTSQVELVFPSIPFILFHTFYSLSYRLFSSIPSILFHAACSGVGYPLLWSMLPGHPYRSNERTLAAFWLAWASIAVPAWAIICDRARAVVSLA